MGILALSIEGYHALGNRDTLHSRLRAHGRSHSGQRLSLCDGLLSFDGPEAGVANVAACSDAVFHDAVRVLNEALVGIHLHLLQVLALSSSAGREERT